MTTPLATPDDVADVWRPLVGVEEDRVFNLIAKASSRLRQQCPFDIDARIALYMAGSSDPTALDPTIVADTVATIVKRFLVNVEGVATQSDSAGPFAHSATYVNRYDKSGTDVRGAIQVTEADINQLRPAVPAHVPSTFRVGIPLPQILIPGVLRRNQGVVPGLSSGSIIVPDVNAGYGTE